MSSIRILLIEDEVRWQAILMEALDRAFEDHSVCLVEDYATARKKIQAESFDLISIDLALDIKDLESVDLPGMLLLREIRNSSRNSSSGLIILSARTTAQRVREALKDYKVFDFLDKLEYLESAYLEAAQCAVREALLEKAESLRNQSFKFSVTYDNERFLRGQLNGPGTQTLYRAGPNSTVAFDEFARRADNLNTTLWQGHTGEWRKEARKLGDGLYLSLVANADLLKGLTTALTLTNQRPANLTFEFIGPVEGLSCPFELLRGSDYLAMDHVILRRTERQARIGVAEPFAKFVESLVRKREAMRILVVGSSGNGTVPAAEEEAERLADFFEAKLDQLAIPHYVTRMIGQAATCKDLRETLKNGYHLFHYAGHGDYDEGLPEGSPLILADGNFTASDLRMALREVDLRLAFLSCCLGARTAAQVGRGDFHGFFHALLESGVPTTIGYRWEVEDDSALQLATDFYSELFRSFCPGRALLRARQSRSVNSDEKRDDPTWASPVLLMEG